MKPNSLILVFGGSGGTGKHFISHALEQGHRVRAIVRTPSKLTITHDNLEVIQGDLTDTSGIDAWVRGSDCIAAMLGDRVAQNKAMICTPFVKALVPCMRRNGVKRFVYQAGGFSRPYKQGFPVMLWGLSMTVGRIYGGQHNDNEAVMEYLCEEAGDIEWMVHRAGIRGEGPSRGQLKRSPNEESKVSMAVFEDTAKYNLMIVGDEKGDAVHTMDTSYYV